MIALHDYSLFFNTQLYIAIACALKLFVMAHIMKAIPWIGENTVDYITPKEASQKWVVSERRIQKPCEEGRIDGVVRFWKDAGNS